jgi:hypothetical protein
MGVNTLLCMDLFEISKAILMNFIEKIAIKVPLMLNITCFGVMPSRFLHNSTDSPHNWFYKP